MMSNAFAFIHEYQLEIMLMLAGTSFMLALLIALLSSFTISRRIALILVELTGSLLVGFDRVAYLTSGDISDYGTVMVRVSNFMVFALTSFAVFAFNQYLVDLLRNEAEIKKAPIMLRIVNVLSLCGVALIVFNQFSGIIYTIDANNQYHRSPLFLLCYVAPVLGSIMQIVVIFVYRKSFSRYIFPSLFLFLVMPVVAAVVQVFSYGLSLANITIAFMGIVIYVFAHMDMNDKIGRAHEIEKKTLEDKTRESRRLFEQTAAALVNAIDSKDGYSHGHSLRVAEYSRKMAELLGKSEDECYEVYYAALLHDVGKVGISDSVIMKKTKLTKEETEELKQHTVLGAQILDTIEDYPNIKVGAMYHHERYDGSGYPEGLAGEDIPEVARIISVANAYDVMTSKRANKKAMAQQLVREELVKRSGIQFDPKIAKVMLHLVDLDSEYRMKELDEVTDLREKQDIECTEYRSDISEGIVVNAQPTKIRMKCELLESESGIKGMPTIVLFDSMDGRVYSDEYSIKEKRYYEYCELWFDGHINDIGVRRIQSEKIRHTDEEIKQIAKKSGKETEYLIEAVKVKDHILLTIDDGETILKHIIALPDSVRFAYIGLTGEQCRICDVRIDKDEQSVQEDYIPRIVEEVSYINRLEGDIPNLQINGYRSDATKGIPLKDDLEISFHTMSLPTAHLVWHTAYLVVFASDDGTVNGNNYREFAFIRLDGENWESDGVAKNKLVVKQSESFKGWEVWKEKNKAGFNCKVVFRKTGKTIVTTTENLGLYLENRTKVLDNTKEFFVALTGDQCAITDIRIKEG